MQDCTTEDAAHQQSFGNADEFRSKHIAPLCQTRRPTADGVSATLFTYEAMQHHRKAAMLPLLNHWGLELHQPTPDFLGIESLLRARYGYWNDDIEHTNPFPNGN